MKIPCIFPDKQGILPETGCRVTACTTSLRPQERASAWQVNRNPFLLNYSMRSSFQRIEAYFEEFQHGFSRCKLNNPAISADIKDAYNRLSRLRDRYCTEKTNLSQQQLSALSKVFDNDPFIKGLCTLRQVGEHVRRVEGVKIFTTANVPVELPSSCSAGTVFLDNHVTLPTIDGSRTHIDHLENLEEAERRISKAVSKTKTTD